MRSKEVEIGIKKLEDLQEFIEKTLAHNNTEILLTNLDEGKNKFKYVLNYIKELEKLPNKIREHKQKFEKDSKTEKVFMTQSSQINASLISFCDELLEGE